MASWVLRGDRDSVLCSDGRCFGQNRVFDAPLNLLDLLSGLFLGKTVEEDVDIRGWGELLMVVMTQSSF